MKTLGHLFSSHLNVIVGGGTMLIALFALAFTIWRGFMQIRHDKIKMKPRLVDAMFHSYRDGNCVLQYCLINHGLGPRTYRGCSVVQW